MHEEDHDIIGFQYALAVYLQAGWQPYQRHTSVEPCGDWSSPPPPSFLPGTLLFAWIVLLPALSMPEVATGFRTAVLLSFTCIMHHFPAYIALLSLKMKAPCSSKMLAVHHFDITTK